jgi:hypothetical protein
MTTTAGVLPLHLVAVVVVVVVVVTKRVATDPLGFSLHLLLLSCLRLKMTLLLERLMEVL